MTLPTQSPPPLGETGETAQFANPDPHNDSPRQSDYEHSNQHRQTFRLRPPSSLPPWIDSYEEQYGTVPDEQFRLLSQPARSVPAQHIVNLETQRRVSRDGFVHWEDPSLGPGQRSRAKIPHFLRYGRASMRGRKWDHLRTAEPVIVPGYMPSTAPSTEAWHEFLRSSAWGRPANEDTDVLDYSELEKLQPGFNRPIDLSLTPARLRQSRRRRTLVLYKRIWIFILRHSLSPLLFRLMVMVTSILALGVASRILEIENPTNIGSAEKAQSIVAVSVDSVAVPYLGYMIWDEYTGKPIGLRSGVSKMSLILLDLVFIIFKSASTALAFESVIYHNMWSGETKSLAGVVAAFQLFGVMSWTMTFTVNIFRTVEQLGGGDDDDDI